METEIIRDKIKVFFDKQYPIHIVTKTGEWVNGYIFDPGNEDYFIVNEFKKGEMPVFYVEIERVEKYEVEVKNKEGENDGNKR